MKNILEFWNISVPELSERKILPGNPGPEVGDLTALIGLREQVFNDEIEYTFLLLFLIPCKI